MQRVMLLENSASQVPPSPPYTCSDCSATPTSPPPLSRASPPTIVLPHGCAQRLLKDSLDPRAFWGWCVSVLWGGVSLLTSILGSCSHSREGTDDLGTSIFLTVYTGWLYTRALFNFNSSGDVAEAYSASFATAIQGFWKYTPGSPSMSLAGQALSHRALGLLDLRRERDVWSWGWSLTQSHLSTGN